jgi:hypothetical protein
MKGRSSEVEEARRDSKEELVKLKGKKGSSAKV